VCRRVATSNKEKTKEGIVYVIRSHEGWRTPDESWLDMEAAEDRETFFVNMALGEEEDENGERRPSCA
jgi:hypothetical protein